MHISANFYGYIKKQNILQRNKSKIGDSIWVFRKYWSIPYWFISYAKKIKNKKNLKNYFLKKYLYPKPCMLGSKIISYANSCIDISDGFFGDLKKLLTFKTGIDLYLDRIPFSNNAKIF